VDNWQTWQSITLVCGQLANQAVNNLGLRTAGIVNNLDLRTTGTVNNFGLRTTGTINNFDLWTTVTVNNLGLWTTDTAPGTIRVFKSPQVWNPD
jgi:hypothetical protein